MTWGKRRREEYGVDGVIGRVTTMVNEVGKLPRDTRLGIDDDGRKDVTKEEETDRPLNQNTKHNLNLHIVLLLFTHQIHRGLHLKQLRFRP